MYIHAEAITAGKIKGKIDIGFFRENFLLCLIQQPEEHLVEFRRGYRGKGCAQNMAIHAQNRRLAFHQMQVRGIQFVTRLQVVSDIHDRSFSNR